jgi:hypothetical protein
VLSTVLKAADRDEIVSGVILKQLNELKYEQLREWFAAINRAVTLDCPAEDEIDALAEIKAARDILEHNAGVINEIYHRKAGKRARYEVGHHVEIDGTYHLESWRLMKKVVGTSRRPPWDGFPNNATRRGRLRAWAMKRTSMLLTR